MITQKEQEKIYVLSDTELYPQAVAFMHGIARELPPTQINGLLNISLANTYARLTEFVDFQYKRSTWKPSERHIPEFYRKLIHKLKDLEQEALKLIALRKEKALEVDREEVKMAYAREFIQHLLAENDYMRVTRKNRSENFPGSRANSQEGTGYDQRKSWSTRGEIRQ